MTLITSALALITHAALFLDLGDGRGSLWVRGVLPSDGDPFSVLSLLILAMAGVLTGVLWFRDRRRERSADRAATTAASGASQDEDPGRL